MQSFSVAVFFAFCCVSNSIFFSDQHGGEEKTSAENNGLCWEDSNEKIDLVSLSLKEPILFYDEVGIIKYRTYK